MGFLLVLLGIYLVATAVVIVSVTLTRQSGVASGSGAGTFTRLFLVFLRLAIGWHFLMEGHEKFKTDTWTSEAYLRESVGPAAPWFRTLAGDSVRDRLTLGPNGEFPAELATDWQAYFDRFQSYYNLEEEQRKKAQIKFDQSKSSTLTWLKSGTKVVQMPSSQPPPLMVELTVAQRVEAYQKKEEKARDLESQQLPYYGPAVLAKWKELKTEANRIRAELKGDLAQQAAAMKNTLPEVLTAEQKKLDPIKEPVRRSWTQWSYLDWSDFMVKYGLVAVGFLLLAGFLTRSACLAGAMFLLMFYLAMPPLPGLPENPRSEGHYLLINKNLVEMLALLALATTRSGRWAGLDGLVQFLNPWRKPVQGAILSQEGRGADVTKVIPATVSIPPGEMDATLTISTQDTKDRPGKSPGEVVPLSGSSSISKEISHGP